MTYSGIMWTPSLAQASKIPIQGPRKAAIELASRFEEAILARSPQDSVFGPERTLAADYEASPRVVRQALRILESRFLGSMRRGVGGGLILRKPSLADSAELMAIYLSAISTDRQEVRDAIAMLAPEMSDCSDTARAFVGNLLSALDSALDDNDLLQIRSIRSRALVIARRIVADLKANRCARLELGTLAALEEKHASGRPIILQAIRILEELEIIEIRLGRGGGIVACQPSPGAVVRAVYSHFVLGDLTMDMAKDIIWSINRANAVRAAAVITPAQSEMLDIFSASQQSRNEQADDHSAEITLWRLLGEISANEVLHMLVRCMFYFRIRSHLEISTYLAGMTSDSILINTCRIAKAVSRKQPDLARQAIIHGEAISKEDMPMILAACAKDRR